MTTTARHPDVGIGCAICGVPPGNRRDGSPPRMPTPIGFQWQGLPPCRGWICNACAIQAGGGLDATVTARVLEARPEVGEWIKAYREECGDRTSLLVFRNPARYTWAWAVVVAGLDADQPPTEPFGHLRFALDGAPVPPERLTAPEPADDQPEDTDTDTVTDDAEEATSRPWWHPRKSA